MIKVIPTSEQIKTIEKYGLRYDDVQMGPGDGEIVVKDAWKLGAEERFYVVARDGTFRIEYKAPVIKW